MIMRLVFLGLAGAVLTGCGPQTYDFLGVPEDESRAIDQDHPEIDSRLRGATTVTKVMMTDYATYQKFKEAGQIIHEERYGRFIYFAVSALQHVPLLSARPGAVEEAHLQVTERYKTEMPD
ncbi:MAG: hypothetical protein ACYTFO_03850 [Planctomycetota bacterium]|jgi:hypothetical protein